MGRKRLTHDPPMLVTLTLGPGAQEGNEIADQLANKGAETYFYGPEPFFGFNGSKYKRES
jgi:hypothetical protein